MIKTCETEHNNICVPSCLFKELLPMTRVRSMQNVKVRGQRSRSQRSQPNLIVSGLWLQFEFTYDDEMMHLAWYCLRDVPYCFSRSSVKFQGNTYGSKNHQIWPKLGVLGLYLQFESTNGYEMMQKAWGSIKEMSYCFSGSYVKLQGRTAKQIVEFEPNWAFPDTLTPV